MSQSQNRDKYPVLTLLGGYNLALCVNDINYYMTNSVLSQSSMPAEDLALWNLLSRRAVYRVREQTVWLQ